jgi:hypothetical protein
MKILLVPFKTKEFIYKTDNTFIRGSEEFFIPEFVTELGASPSMVVRIEKSAKYVSEKFASRYYSELSTGINLYPFDLLNIDNESSFYLKGSKAFTLDNTTFCSKLFVPKKQMLSQDCQISKKNLEFSTGKMTLSLSMQGLPGEAEINKIIEKASKYATLKCGDLIFMDLSDPAEVCKGEEILLCHPSGPRVNLFIK